MTGRDLVKFIVSNNLFDKQLSDSSSIKFIDCLSNDDEVTYTLTDDRGVKISLKDESDNYLIYQNNLMKVIMNGLKQLDSMISDIDVVSRYNTYSDSFKSWLSNLDDPSQILSVIVDYANNDSNFSRNCSTYNKMISYLEGKDVDSGVLLSAEIAWFQYMRECREVSY